jgi:hypothetical protein
MSRSGIPGPVVNALDGKRLDALQDIGEQVRHHVVGESQRQDATSPQRLIAKSILFFLGVMHLAVYLDAQPGLGAIEVRDVPKEDSLTVERKPKSISPKLIPDPGFAGGHLLSELPGQMNLERRGVPVTTSLHAPDSTQSFS